MTYAGVKDDKKIDDLIAFLKQFGRTERKPNSLNPGPLFSYSRLEKWR